MEVFEAQVAGRLVLPWEPISIMPIGDIQYAGGGRNDPADIDRLRKHVEWGVEHGCWFLGMGDYIDFARPTVRSKLRALGDDDVTEVLLDRAATDLEEHVLAVLRPTRDRWLTLVEGHHYFQHLDGTTTGQRFARELGCRYGGDAAMLRLTFCQEPDKLRGRMIQTKLFVHHGHGGGSTLAGPLAKYERFAAHCAAQVFFIGHHHRVMVVPFDQLDVSSRGEPVLFHHTRAIVLTGSFLRGYMQGSAMGGRARGSYVERAVLPPVALGAPIVTLAPKERHIAGRRVALVDVRGSV